MKKICKLIFSLILIILLASCQASKPQDLTDLMLSPKLDKPLLEGTWQVSKVEALSEKSSNKGPEIGDKLYINNNLVAINNEYAFPPSFLSKYVKLYDYIKNRGYDFPNIDNKESVIVVNASQGQFFARDFIMRSDDEIFFIADDKLIYLSRLSESVDNKIIDKYTKLANKERALAEDNKASLTDVSLLLGVRERLDNNDGSSIDYNYYTYLIRINEEDKIKYKKANDIFLRAQDEYWKVRLLKNNLSGLYDNIEAFPQRLESAMDQQENIDRYTFRDFDMNMRVNYVDMNYISFSYTGVIFDNTITKYAVIDTHELDDNRLLNIDEFSGEKNAGEQFENMIINETTNKLSNVNPNDVIIDNTNFGIVRDNGSWSIQTSIYTKDSQEKASSQIPVRNHIEEKSSNNSTITRDQVRNINSQAKDYLVIENTNYMLIQTADEILIHKINNGTIDKKPYFSISTENPTAIVSIDQQSGTNARFLEDAFVNSNTIIDNN